MRRLRLHGAIPVSLNWHHFIIKYELHAETFVIWQRRKIAGQYDWWRLFQSGTEVEINCYSFSKAIKNYLRVRLPHIRPLHAGSQYAPQWVQHLRPWWRFVHPWCSDLRQPTDSTVICLAPSGAFRRTSFQFDALRWALFLLSLTLSLCPSTRTSSLKSFKTADQFNCH